MRFEADKTKATQLLSCPAILAGLS